MEGEVRVWRIGRQTQVMEASLKEHRGRVDEVRINRNDTQAKLKFIQIRTIYGLGVINLHTTTL